MFQIPVGETAQRRDPTKRAPELLRERKLHPRAGAWTAPGETYRPPRDTEGRNPLPFSEHVTRVAAPMLQRACACGDKPGEGECDQCKLARKARGEFRDGGQAPAIVGEVLRSPGRPLDPATRTSMGDRFQFDFSSVRIHDDAPAARSALAVSALAYTVGRDIAFGAGQYAPWTVQGRRLLAHELTHVVQQHGYARPALQPLTVAPAHGPGESEADATADAVLAGRPVAPRASPAGALHRSMHNKAILEAVRPNAGACLVHLHGEEHTAAAVAKELYDRRCVNYVHLDTDHGPRKGDEQRFLEFDVDVTTAKSKENYTCLADPNRIFTQKGREETVKKWGCVPTHGGPPPKGLTPDIVKAATAELEIFVNAQWGSGISRCRGGSGTADLAGPLPVLALHNNEGKAPILDLYKPQWALPSDPRLKGGPNPDYSADPKNKSDVFFIANPPSSTGATPQARDFDAVKGTYNVGLQAQPVPAAGEDGSLSVALQNQRFINIERKGRDTKVVDLGSGFQGHDAVYIKNYAMAVKALELFNVPDGPCPAAAPSTAPQQTQASAPQGSTAAPNQAAPPTAAPVGSAGEQTTAGKTEDTEPYRRETVEKKDVPPGCLYFEPGTIVKQKSDWAGRISTLPVLDVVNWIVGAWSFGPTAPGSGAHGAMPEVVKAGVSESYSQRTCLLNALKAGIKAHGGNVPKGDLVASGARSFADQNRIWQEKWSFKRGDAFDRISDFAAAKSNGLLTAGGKWNPKNPIHRLMWGVDKPIDKTDPNVDRFLKAGATSLTMPEREQEILMASSAPGVSRHHAGTDFDIAEKGTGKDELEPELWKPGEKYFDAGRWLYHNAATWGFIRPFETKGGHGKGYMPEPWHWSYWPIAQALLEFARSNRKDMEDTLHAHWQDAGKKTPPGSAAPPPAPLPQFEFIWGKWNAFLDNVDEAPRF